MLVASYLQARELELDPLAESLYRQLMSLQSQQGRRAEALETYRCCRHLLSVVPWCRAVGADRGAASQPAFVGWASAHAETHCHDGVG